MGLLSLLAAGSANAQSSPNPEAMAQVPASNPQTAAQQSAALPEGMGVMDRARPEYDASGVPLGGGFTLYPTLAGGVTADDNIYRAPAATSDVFWTVSPRLDLRSQWQQDALQLYAQLDHFAYDTHDTESRTNWIAGVAGKYVEGDDGYLDASGYYFATHESRTSPDLSALALSPTRYRQGHASVMPTLTFDDLSISAGVDYDRYDYDPTKLIGGGEIFNYDRDRNVYEVTGQAAYQFDTNRSAFVRVIYDRRDFDMLFDRNGFDRNSTGYRADAGVEMMLTPVIKANAFAGYLKQNYVAPLSDAQGVDFGAQIDWYVTELFTAHLTASRTIADTITAGASSVDEKSVGVSADYELLRNVLIQAYGKYSDDGFVGISRTDKLTAAGVSARYLMNNYMSAYVGYDYQQRATNAAGRDFTDNMVSIGIRFQT